MSSWGPGTTSRRFLDFDLDLDLRNWFIQFIITLFLIALAFRYFVKSTASNYFQLLHSNFQPQPQPQPQARARRPRPPSSSLPLNNNNNNSSINNQHHRPSSSMPGLPSSSSSSSSSCANCGDPGTKKCSRCKSVRYCSSACQEAHWKAGHKSNCHKVNTLTTNSASKPSAFPGRSRTFSGIALVPASGTSSRHIKPHKEVLFPYDEFIRLYNWDGPAFPPCGLFNCGNSCFANVVLQCLTFTRPLVAYLLEKGHKSECRRNDWCFLCEFQEHVEKATRSSQPLSPNNILSRLANIGGNLGCGRQEDAHEFMRFAIDTMQSVCLDEFGGEKAVHHTSQETTLIQHIFGGRLHSQVMCTHCNKMSNQYDSMMDLTVEIHGDAASLEECLDQFTEKEWLNGENKYKCDGCNDYVKAWKRLSVQRPPNILTVALKRFQSGRFGKINKRVTFPENLDLSPYMSEGAGGTDLYKLYAVVVHVDMLNASFFGHYICYTKDFSGNWYRVDDCKVTRVDSEEVLSQGAYMLLYSRVSVRPSSLRDEPSQEQEPMGKQELESCTKEKGECFQGLGAANAMSTYVSQVSEIKPEIRIECYEGDGVVNSESNLAAPKAISSSESESSSGADYVPVRSVKDITVSNSELASFAVEEVSCQEKDASVPFSSQTASGDPKTDAMDSDSNSLIHVEVTGGGNYSSTAAEPQTVEMEDRGFANPDNNESGSALVGESEVNGVVYSLLEEAA